MEGCPGVYLSSRVLPTVCLLNQETVTMPDRKSLEELNKALSKDGKLIVAYLEQRFTDFETKFMEIVSSNKSEISKLNSEVHTLKKEVQNLKSLIDDGEAYERRDTIVLSGDSIPPVSQGERCSDIARNLIKEELKINLPPETISTSHRLGRKPQSQMEDRRKIIVKLCRRDLKGEIISASRKGGRSSKLFVNESLTPQRSAILFALRRMKREHPNVVKGCQSFDGRIYAYTKPPSTSPSARDQRHLINTHEALVNFCREHVKRPLDNFIESWNY